MNKIINYLTALEKNNNREWYHSHKNEYQSANEEFLDLIKELIIEIGKTDTSILDNIPKELTFKLVKDTRFSHDKSPYNPAFRAHISSKGKLPVPVGYFIVIKPNNGSFLGGGLFELERSKISPWIRSKTLQQKSEITLPNMEQNGKK